MSDIGLNIGVCLWVVSLAVVTFYNMRENLSLASIKDVFKPGYDNQMLFWDIVLYLGAWSCTGLVIYSMYFF